MSGAAFGTVPIEHCNACARSLPLAADFCPACGRPAYMPARRDISLLARCRVLFGEGTCQLGWIFLGFGLIFCWVFLGSADLTSWFWFTGEVNRTTGIVTQVEPTRSEVNEQPVFAVHYRFFSGDKTTRSGISYSTNPPKTGVRCTVESVSGHPDISRIEGMQRAPFSAGVLFVVIFPLAGLCFVIHGTFLRGRKSVWLLRHGIGGEGWVATKTATGMKVNYKTVYAYKISYRTPAGTVQQFAQKTTVELASKSSLQVLYEPFNPARAMCCTLMPGAPTIDKAGRICMPPGSARAGFLAIILPAVTAGVVFTFLYITCFAGAILRP